jgi:hypothetical protein
MIYGTDKKQSASGIELCSFLLAGRLARVVQIPWPSETLRGVVRADRANCRFRGVPQ